MAHAHHSSRGKTKYPSQPAADLGWTHAHPVSLEFDFVIAERPKYVPNSGPSLAPIGILPLHDKEGVIEDVINMEGNARYIVSYKHKPALRMCIKAENVRDYVSARTLEDWEWKHTQIRNELERERLDPKATARRHQAAKLLEQKEAREAHESAARKRKSGSQFGTRRKARGGRLAVTRKSTIRTMSPGAGIGLGVMSATSGQDTAVPVRKSSFISPRRPSTSTPSKQRGLAEAIYSDIESEDELNTSAALDRQLNGTPSHLLLRSKSAPFKQNAQFAVEINRPPTSTTNTTLAPKRGRKSSSPADTSRSVTPAVHDYKRRKMSDVSNSLASTSSRAALKIFEQLESRKTGGENSISKRDLKSLPRESRDKIQNLRASNLPDPARTTKAQANKRKYLAAYGFRCSSPNQLAPALSSHLRESTSPSQTDDGTPGSHRPKRVHSERPPSRDQDKSGYRRSERSSSRASVNYTLPPPLHPEDLEPDEEESEPEYDVEAILGEKWRTVRGRKSLFYLIRWQGDYQNTWEPASHVGMGSVEKWEKEKKTLERPKEMKPKVRSVSKEMQDETSDDAVSTTETQRHTRFHNPATDSG